MPMLLRVGREAASAIGKQIDVVSVNTNQEIEAAFPKLVDAKIEALVVPTSPLFSSRRVQIVTLATHYKMPAIYFDRPYPEVGGLMSYGTSLADQARQVGVYTGRILKGEKPANLPVMQPTKFELVINLQTARLLAIDVPQTLLALADEVIE